MSTETVQLKKSRVLMAFKGASTDQQKLLKDLVGDQVDFNQKITAEYVGKEFLSIYRDAFLIDRE